MAYDITRQKSVTGLFVSENAGPGPAVRSTGYQRFDIYARRKGSKVHSYKSLIRTGQNASSSYLRDDIRVTAREAMVARADITVRPPTSAPYNAWTYRVATPIPTAAGAPVRLADLRQDALKKLYSKIDDALSRFDTGVAVGELRETKRMLGQTAKDLLTQVSLDLRHFRTFRKWAQYRYMSKAKFARLVGNKWLEYAFGWKPLINDANALHSALTDERIYPSLRVTAKATLNKLLPTTITTDGSGYIGSRIESSVRQISTVRYTFGLEVPQAYLGRWGLSPWDALSTAYELVPWSFLVDYFFDLGTFLRSPQYVSMKVRYGSVAFTDKAIQSVRQVPYAVNGARMSMFYPGHAIFERYAYERLPLSAIPIAIPSFKLFEGLTVGTRVANIVALLSTSKLFPR